MPDAFSDDELRALKQLAQRAGGGPTRRDALAGLGLLGGGALLGGTTIRSLLGTASAQASTTDGDPDLGGPNDRIDAFLDGLDALSIAFDTSYEAVDAIGTASGATALDLSAANMATVTLGGDVTFSLTNASSSPPGNSLLVKITQDGSTQHAITWPSINWVGGGAPPDPETGAELEVFVETYDGGSTWYGGEAGRYP